MSTPANDDVAVFDPEPLGAVDFEPQRVGSGRRATVPVAAWVIGLAVVVGIGAFAGGAVVAPLDRDSGAVAAETALDEPPVSINATPLGSPEPHWPPLLRPIVTFGRIEVHVPGPTSSGSETAQMGLRGTVRIRAARLTITLERAGNVLGLASVDVSDPNGGIRRDGRPTFDATFDLPESDVGETLWIGVTAYDDGGMPLGETRRPYWAGLPASP